MDMPLEILILGIVLSVLNLLDRMLKLSTGKTGVQHIRGKINHSKIKIANSIKESQSFSPDEVKDIVNLKEIEELVDDLVDLGERLTFSFST